MSVPPLSVLATLRAIFILWAKNFWTLFALVFATNILPVSLHHFSIYFVKQSSLWSQILDIFQIPLELVFGAMTAAAVLGLLKGQSQGLPIWNSIRETVRIYTWTLVRKMILLILLTIPFGLVFAGIIFIAGFNGIVVLIGVAFYLIFLKYALADPFIVLENFPAWEALEESWRLTKGHLVYVFGCFIFLGLGEVAFSWLLGRLPGTGIFLNWILAMLASLTQPLWIILGWCMYFGIKEYHGRRTMERAPWSFRVKSPNTDPYFSGDA